MLDGLANGVPRFLPSKQKPFSSASQMVLNPDADTLVKPPPPSPHHFQYEVLYTACKDATIA